MNEPCLVCGSRFQVENAHWPKAIGMGRKRKKVHLPTLPLCVRCHEFGQHVGNEEIIMALIEKAPTYWQEHGMWEEARPVFETWLSRREYVEMTWAR